MWSCDSGSETDSDFCISTAMEHCLSRPTETKQQQKQRQRKPKKLSVQQQSELVDLSPLTQEGQDPNQENVWQGALWEASWPRKPKSVMLEGYVDTIDDHGSDGSSVGRAKSLTDDDLEELKGCLDLGFGFSYEEIPELCGTLPALELCYSMSQRFLDEQQQPAAESVEVAASTAAAASLPIANWKISSPGDSPDEVKARLKYWAQAVACTVKLCS